MCDAHVCGECATMGRGRWYFTFDGDWTDRRAAHDAGRNELQGTTVATLHGTSPAASLSEARSIAASELNGKAATGLRRTARSAITSGSRPAPTPTCPRTSAERDPLLPGRQPPRGRWWRRLVDLPEECRHVRPGRRRRHRRLEGRGQEHRRPAADLRGARPHGFSIDPTGRHFRHCAFKSFEYQLTAAHCTPSPGYTNEIHIYTPPTRVGGKSGGGGDGVGLSGSWYAWRRPPAIPTAIATSSAIGRYLRYAALVLGMLHPDAAP